MREKYRSDSNTQPNHAYAFSRSQPIYGGSGNDYFRNDTSLRTKAYGGEGNDTLIGGSGNDYLDGGNGSDLLNGQAGFAAILDDADDKGPGDTWF